MHSNIQLVIDVIIMADLIVSTYGGSLKNKNPELADKCFMVGKILLVIAVLLTIFKRMSKIKTKI